MTEARLHEARSADWTCPSCGRSVRTPYCATCGEHPRDAQDLTPRGFVLQILQAFTSVDGKLLSSFRALILRPGELSAAWVRGQRVAYVGPFQLFFLANVAFFAVQSLSPTHVFSTTLDSHLHVQDWKLLAQQLVSRKLERMETTLEHYAPLFDRAVVLNAKSLIILMVVPFALLLPLVLRNARKPFVAHAVFALHVYAFLLCLFCASLVVSDVHRLLGGAGLDSPRVDLVMSLVNLGACALYLYFATGTFYGARGWQRLLQVGGLAFAIAAIVLGYRFALLLITLYGT